MKDALKRFATKLNPFTNTPATVETPAIPAPSIEADDVDAYSSEAAELIINRLVDQLDSTRAQMQALAQTNRNLTAQLTHANATVTALRKQPKNKYWSQRSGK